MVSNALEELAQDVARSHVRAKVLGQESVAATLQMALDELLEGLVAERVRLGRVNSAPEEVSGL